MRFKIVLVVSLSMMFILSACGGTLPTTQQIPSLIPQTGGSIGTALATVIPTSAATQVPGNVTVDVSGVAQSSSSKVVPAVAAGPNVAPYNVLPQFTQLTLQGYPVSGSNREAQIMVFPFKDLAVNYAAQNIPWALYTLLSNQQVGQNVPFLPVYNAAQMFHSNVKFLDFKNGKGVRYLTQYSQGLSPINNQDLFYTFQGLTSDNNYYISVIMPVNLSSLPTSATDTTNLPPEFSTNYQKYISDTTDMLNQRMDGDFTPDLSKLDQLVESINVK